MTNRKTFNATIAVSSVFLLGIVIFIIYPTFRDIQRLNIEINNQKSFLENRYQQGLLLQKTRNKFKSVKQALPRFKNLFFTKNDDLGLITNLESLASAHNVSLKINLATQQVNTVGIYNEIPINLNIRGDYVDVVKYLDSLEREAQYLNINKLSFNVARAVRIGLVIPGAVDLVASGKTYWQNPESNIWNKL